MLRQLKGDPKLGPIPVLILTNRDDAEGISEAMELGAKEYMLKSTLDPEIFIEKVASYLP